MGEWGRNLYNHTKTCIMQALVENYLGYIVRHGAVGYGVITKIKVHGSLAVQDFVLLYLNSILLPCNRTH
jgi:hypothetical protein